MQCKFWRAITDKRAKSINVVMKLGGKDLAIAIVPLQAVFTFSCLVFCFNPFSTFLMTRVLGDAGSKLA
jgi:hypothetical protein